VLYQKGDYQVSVEKIWIDGENDTHTAEERAYLVPFLAETSDRVVIVLPGGGYEHRADHEGAPVAEWLNKNGISAFVLHYRLSPKQQCIPLEDGKSAIRYVRAHADEYGIDPSKIGILGFSAGGHLAAITGTVYEEQPFTIAGVTQYISSRPDVMILCYPVITMEQYGHAGSRLALLGAETSAEQMVAYSAEQRVTSQTPPTFLWHNADDDVVPVQNSLQMALSLEQHHIPFELHIYESGGHGQGLALEHPVMGNWTKQCMIWLHRQGW
jgi:acetyl esterase/lipase